MDLSAEKIKEIAEQLAFGWECYIHRETKEIFPMPNPYGEYADVELEYADEVKENFFDYIRIECIPTHESFQFMEDFIEERVEDIKIRNRLINALNRRSPFRNFKDVLYNCKGALKIWEKYKIMRIGQWVVEDLKWQTKDEE